MAHYGRSKFCLGIQCLDIIQHVIDSITHGMNSSIGLSSSQEEHVWDFLRDKFQIIAKLIH